MTIEKGQRVKDRAGHYGTVLAIRPQPRAANGDAALVRWELTSLVDSWAYVADLTPVRRRRHVGTELESEMAVADYVEASGTR